MSSPIDPSTDPYSYLGFIPNPNNGSITRIPNFIATSPPSQDHGNPFSALSKDIPINQENKTWARIYIPKSTPGTKMPLFIYFHGGGFVSCSADSLFFQKFCSDLTSEIPAVLVSVDYRNAPEHRLPAAYDDCTEALRWIEAVEDEWLTEYADFSECLLMGTSAGGNIAYHVGLRAALTTDEWSNITIRGLILHQPFFGGVNRTQSEIRMVKDKVLPLPVTDLLWDLALPVGVDRDHQYCNLETRSSYYSDDVFEMVKGLGWKFVVSGCDGDPLVDRQKQLVEMLKGKGIDVVGDFHDGGFHGIELSNDSRANVFYRVVKGFVLSFLNSRL